MPSATTSIRNDTPRPLKLMGADGRELKLAPLELRQMASEDLAGFDFSEAQLAGIVSEWSEPPLELAEKLIGVGFALGIFLFVVCGVASGLSSPFAILDSFQWKATVWTAGGLLLVLALSAMAIHLTKSARLVLRFVAQAFSLLVILAIGLGFPAGAVYFFGDGARLLKSPPSTELFGRLLQVGFIATASLMPTLLFFLFDRYQLKTMRERLYRDLFRLDSGLKTRSEIDARYGSQIREVYGPEEQGRGRLTPGTRWPVLVCAFVITAGWLATFSPLVPAGGGLAQYALLPHESSLIFGFMGAYFFGLQLIARRYSRGDLKPKTYGYITIRILSVAVLSWILEVVISGDSSVKLVLAFLIGILPNEFFTLIRERFRGLGPDRLVPESEKHPLTRLEGIDLYDRARLEQEGIVNIESLAHHELIQLVLETQVPVPRLIDWMDQAILYLHVTPESPDSPEDNATRRTLREFGIRTTTDLLSCWEAADRRGERDDFRKILGGESKPYRLEVIRDALLDDEWLDRIRDWRNDADRPELEIRAVPKTFEGKLAYAERLKSEHRYKDAIQTTIEALEIRDDAEGRVRLADLLAGSPVPTLRDLEAAKLHSRRAFELGSQNLEVLQRIIPIFELVGDVESALKACDAAIALVGDPKDDEARTALTILKAECAKLGVRTQSNIAVAQ